MTKKGYEILNEKKNIQKDKKLFEELMKNIEIVLKAKIPENYKEYIETERVMKKENIKISKMGEGYLKGIVVVTMNYQGDSMTLEIRNPKLRVELIDEFVKDRNKIINGEITKEIIDKYFD